MREITLRDANQQFSKLVREVEETGETVTVMRKGKPAVKIVAADPVVRTLSPAQEAALKSILDTARRLGRKSKGRKLTRDEMHER